MSDNGVEKLQRDLVILEAMVGEIEEYLNSGVVFWPMERGDLPRLTLGGYLMRQYRLSALKHLLDEGEKDRLAAAIENFRQALVEKIVRFETKAHEELGQRFRQWDQFLLNIKKEASSPAYYASAVETRVIIEALMAQLQIAPYRLPARAKERVNLMDRQLRSQFQKGDFVWPEAWQPAYPPDRYWWLYGQPVT